MDRKKKVLVLTTSFPVHEGIAVGIHVIEKCRHLVKNGWKVQVVAPYHYKSKRHERIEGIEVLRFRYFLPVRFQKVAYGSGIPTNVKRSLLAKLQLPLFLISFMAATIAKGKDADVIHCHWSIAGLVGILAGKILKKKTVFMMHGAEIFVMGNHPVLRFILKKCDFLISNSSFTEKQTLKVYPVKNHKVIPPGVDTERFYPRKNILNLKKRLQIPEKGVFILTIGKFIPRKGIEYLIEAMDILINNNKQTDLYLRIGGRGPLKKKYQRMINQYGLDNHIDFLGYISDEEIPAYYSASDVFVLPSIIDMNGDTEGLGVVLLEANACETPVVASKVGGIVDVIKDGENGFFVKEKSPEDLAQKIMWVIKDEKQKRRMGEKGRERILKLYSWEKIAKEIIEVYSKIN